MSAKLNETLIILIDYFSAASDFPKYLSFSNLIKT